jgi:hypothetical protein
MGATLTCNGCFAKAKKAPRLKVEFRRISGGFPPHFRRFSLRELLGYAVHYIARPI